MGQNALSQSDSTILKSAIFPEQTNETGSFFTCWCKFTKIKIWSKIVGWAWLKIGVANLVLGLNNDCLNNEQMELNDFLQAYRNPHKLKGRP